MPSWAPIIAGTRLKKRWGTAGLEPSACVLPGRIAQPDPQSGISRMFDAAAARRHMVDGQIRTADVTNPSLIAAMQAVPREKFVAPDMADQAYRDGDVSIGYGRALVRPIVLGKLLQAANPRAGDQVLVVGCGTGYSAAVLAHMDAAVVALEENPDLAGRAESA